MFQFSYKLKVAERVKAKCECHPRYNPERDGRGGVKGGCSTCFTLYVFNRQGSCLIQPIGSSSRERLHGPEPSDRASVTQGTLTSHHTSDREVWWGWTYSPR